MMATTLQRTESQTSHKYWPCVVDALSGAIAISTRWLLPVLLFICLFSFSRPLDAQASSTPDSLSPRFTTTEGDALIAPGDLLSITVFDTPEFSGTIRVSNEGNLTLPLVGSLHLEGMSAENAALFIRKKLINENFVKDPQVNVSFVDFINQSAVVLGEVEKPGAVQILGSRTLWEIIGAAGGITPAAANRVVIIHRSGTSHPQHLDVNFDRDLSTQLNPQIFPGDTIQVPRAGMVYVVGEVGKQGAFPILHEKLTLVQAVSLAEGLKYTSKSNEVRLIRTGTNGREIYKIDVPEVLKGKTPDIELRNDDIVYVPNSAIKVVITRGIVAAIAISSSLAVYRFQ
jgi:polysaccharide biosynthesis/export protein